MTSVVLGSKNIFPQKIFSRKTEVNPEKEFLE